MHVVETLRDGELVAVRFELSEDEYREALINKIKEKHLGNLDPSLEFAKIVHVRGKKKKVPRAVEVYFKQVEEMEE